MAKQQRASRVMDSLREIRGDIPYKELAAVLHAPDGRRKSAANVSSAFRGESNLLLVDAEAIAKKLGRSLEVVEHGNPIDEFRRALESNRDLSTEWRETIWGAFEKAKAQAMRGNPASRRTGGPPRERPRAAASSE